MQNKFSLNETIGQVIEDAVQQVKKILYSGYWMKDYCNLTFQTGSTSNAGS